MAPKVRLRLEPYDPDARDADGDGIIQEGTAWERPAATRLVTELGEEIARGLTSESRPRLRVIDSEGKERPYTPSYGSAGLDTAQRPRATPPPKLQSLKDRGYASVGDLLASGRIRPPRTEPKATEPTPEETTQRVQAAVEAFVRAAPASQQFPKRMARDRAKRKAEGKAQELAFTKGHHVMLENDLHFVVISDTEFQSLVDTFGEDEVRKAVTVTHFRKPIPKEVDLSEARKALRGPESTTGEIDAERYLDGVMDIHYGSGVPDDISDDVFAAVMFDENITDEFGNPIENEYGDPVTFDDFMSGRFSIPLDDSVENRRFRITALKSEVLGEKYGGIWAVYKFVDKETGDTWYIKSSTYGAHDGMLENIGMRAGALTDLAAKPDEKNIKTGATIMIYKGGRREARWTAMKSIDEWESPAGETLRWETAGDVGGVDTDTVDVGDIAQIAILDWVLDNSDRHHNNFMVATDSKGVQRVGIIDNGLLFGGRVFDDPATPTAHDTEPEAVDYDDLAAIREGLTIEEYIHSGKGHWGSVIMQQFGVSMLASRFKDPEASRRFDEASYAMIRLLEENLDSLLSDEYFEKRGIPLTETEKSHLDSMRRVAQARLRALKSNPDLIRNWFEQNYSSAFPDENEPQVA